MKLTQEGIIKQGFEIECCHLRRWEDCPHASMTVPAARASDKHELVAKGGETEVYLTKAKQSWRGSAVCSELDQYNKKIGFQIAAGRALKQALSDLEG
tara:strand:+ start:55 stop:348 length:294 start_codon:yes stop_codon:yes gene_type:complete